MPWARNIWMPRQRHLRQMLLGPPLPATASSHQCRRSASTERAPIGSQPLARAGQPAACGRLQRPDRLLAAEISLPPESAATRGVGLNFICMDKPSTAAAAVKGVAVEPTIQHATTRRRPAINAPNAVRRGLRTAAMAAPQKGARSRLRYQPAVRGSRSASPSLGGRQKIQCRNCRADNATSPRVNCRPLAPGRQRETRARAQQVTAIAR